MKHVEIPKILLKRVEELEDFYRKNYEPVVPFVRQCFLNTMETTVFVNPGEEAFVITGDIPAMWLRDSAAQLHPYLKYAKEDEDLYEILASVLRRQISQVCSDSYANAFNEQADGKGWITDHTRHNPIVWERKYEVDSLCAPINFAYELYQATGRTDMFDRNFYQMVTIIVTQWELERNHQNSDYYFERKNAPQSDTLANHGKGNAVDYTGMTWSGFRPSDDCCVYGYLIPSNMLACVALKRVSSILKEAYHDGILANRCQELEKTIRNGISTYGIIENEKYGKIYAYETDGKGNDTLMDDANVPSLLSSSYIGFSNSTDEIYQNTRRYILSPDNPYYYEGQSAKGIGSPHTPEGYIWPISLIMQALTGDSREEIENCLEMLVNTHAGTNYIHESFHKDHPEKYTRPWFAWANSLFGELIDTLCEKNIFK